MIAVLAGQDMGHQRGADKALGDGTAWHLGLCDNLTAGAGQTRADDLVHDVMAWNIFQLLHDICARIFEAAATVSAGIAGRDPFFYPLEAHGEGFALARGARVLCCMEPPHVLDRLRFDPDVREKAMTGAARLNAANDILITSDVGTALVMNKAGRRGLANYGAADTPGHIDFWGLGAVQAAQREGTTQGRLVLDVGDSIFHIGRYVDAPVTLDFEDGRLVSIAGGLDARLIRAELDAAGDNAYLAGHMAWGVDPRARWTQPITQTPDTGGGGADIESTLGAVQVQLGSNDDVAFGGTIRSKAHLGLCLRNASLSLDGHPVVKDGVLV